MSAHPVRILLANVFADEYYRTALHSRLGAGPRQYLLGRGVTPKILDDPGWSIGYASPARTGLVDQLRALPWPYADDELLDTGLVARTRSGELVDRFRDRVMFGIRPARRTQLVLGFTGRKSPRSVDWIRSISAPPTAWSTTRAATCSVSPSNAPCCSTVPAPSWSKVPSTCWPSPVSGSTSHRSVPAAPR